MSRLISLTVTGFKRIAAARVALKDGVNEVAGKNGAGKSSLLDAVASLLSGKEIPDKPIRTGSKAAEIVGETEDLVITRRITASGPTLSITNKAGAPFKSPQEMLDRLTGGKNARLFDPGRFIRESDTPEGRQRQKTQLQVLVGIDFAAVDARRQRAYDERTLVNRQASEFRAAATQMPMHEDAPAEEVSAAAIIGEIERANAHNLSVDGLQRPVDDAKKELADLDEALGDDEKDIKRLTDELAAAQKMLKQHKLARIGLTEKVTAAEEASKAKTKIDTGPLSERLKTCEASNTKARANRARAAKINEAEAKEKQSSDLTAAIEACDRERQEALRSAKFPIDGLSFDDTGILYKGEPFTQASDAEKLRVALAIYAAQKPELRVMVIRHGSLFDSAGMELLHGLAEQYGLQVLVEVVTDGEGDADAIVIENGEVKQSAAA